MQLFFYARLDDAPKKKLEAAVLEVIPESAVERFDALEDFRVRLHRLVEPDSIAVLMAGDREDLLKMQMLRKLLPEIYVILVLPDQSAGTLELAHLLLPRFLAERDGPFKALSAVLHKMARLAV
jgi:hypothetical protein